MRSNSYQLRIKTLTPIWTGNANKEITTLRETGIIGSLRWWYEALVRGLGGSACDPTNTKCDGKNHCAACELFGCTGWARKFRLEVEKEDDLIVLHFIELKKIEDVEWALLNLTLKIIANYGAIGGKTTFKPTEGKQDENKLHHKDFGLIKIIESELEQFSSTNKKLEEYAIDEKWKKVNQEKFKWVSIQHFWCVNGKYLSRRSFSESSFNKVLGRKEPKNQASQTPSDNASKWLAGSQKESKKVFSFKNPSRTFGFVNPDIIDFNQIKKRLEEVWGEKNDWKFITKDNILKELLGEME